MIFSLFVFNYGASICVYICVSAGAHGSHEKRASDPMELEFKVTEVPSMAIVN